MHAEKPLRPVDLVERTGVNRSTVYRIMPLLLAREYVKKCPCHLAIRANFQQAKKCFILETRQMSTRAREIRNQLIDVGCIQDQYYNQQFPRDVKKESSVEMWKKFKKTKAK